ncbi:MAG: hypothetical protein R3E13_03285 [Alphaproteobacteria bacterium]
MRVRSFVSSVALAGALLSSSALVGEAFAQKGTVLSPSTAWAVNKVNNKAGPYCAMARRYTQNTVLTVARNFASETSFALDFQQGLFRGGAAVHIILDPGAGQQRVYKVVPVSDRAFVVKLGRDGSFFKALDRTGLLRVEVDGRSYHFNMSDIDAGQAKLDACVASMVMPAAGDEALTPAPGGGGESTGAGQQVYNAQQRQEINALRREIADLTQKNEALKLRLDTRESGASEASRSVSQLAQDLRVLEDRNAQLKRELDAAHADLVKAGELAVPADEGAGAQIGALRSENMRLRAEAETAKSARKDLAALEAEFEVLKTQNASLRSSLDARKGDEGVVRELRMQVAALEAENAQMDAKVAAVERQVREEFEQQIAQAEGENRALQETSLQAQAEVERAQRLRAENAAVIESEKSRQAARIAALEVEKQTLEARLADLQQAGESGSADLAALRRENEALQEALSGDKAVHGKKLAGLESEIAALKAGNAALEGRLSSSALADELQAALDKNAALENRILALQAESADKARVLADMGAGAAELQSLQDENARLQQKLASYETQRAQAESLVKRVATLEAEKQTLEARLADLQRAGESGGADIAALRGENEALQAALSGDKVAHGEKLAGLEAEIAALKAENVALEGRLSSSASADELQAALDKNAALLLQVKEQDLKLAELERVRGELAALKARPDFSREVADLKARLVVFEEQAGGEERARAIHVADFESERAALKTALRDVVSVAERYKEEAQQKTLQVEVLEAEKQKLVQRLEARDVQENTRSEELRAAERAQAAVSEEVASVVYRPGAAPVNNVNGAAQETAVEGEPLVKAPKPVKKPGYIAKRNVADRAEAAIPEPAVEDKAEVVVADAESGGSPEVVIPAARDREVMQTLREIEEEMRNTDPQDAERMQRLAREYAALKAVVVEQGQAADNADEEDVVFEASPVMPAAQMSEAQAQEEAMKLRRYEVPVISAGPDVAGLEPSAHEAVEGPEVEEIVLSRSADPFENIKVVNAGREEAADAVSLQPSKPEKNLPGEMGGAASESAESFSLAALITQASVSTPDQIRRVDNAPKDAVAAYQWGADAVYGSAEQRVLSSPAAFDGMVKDYLERTESRCPGEFAIVPDDSVEGGAIRADSYEVACVGGDVSSGASLLFFNQGGVFTVVAHEAPTAELESAMSFRNRVKRIVTGGAAG